MILCDTTIKNKIRNGIIKFEPFIEKNVQPASIDITLSNHFLEPGFSGSIVNLSTPIKYNEFIADKKNGYVLRPHNFVLASTVEYMGIPRDITAWVEGRSSIGRVGLFIQNAGWIDPGFKGTITLELYNASEQSIRLIPGTKVGQIIFSELDNPAYKAYDGKYQGQRLTTGSKIYEDFRQ